MIEERENEGFDSIWDQLLQFPRVEYGGGGRPWPPGNAQPDVCSAYEGAATRRASVG
jgi:hypothetical protein